MTVSEVKTFVATENGDVMVMKTEYDAAQSELAALREELANARESHESMRADLSATDARLTAAELRNAELVELLRKARNSIDPSCAGKALRMDLDAALKPTESGASEYICPGCGGKGFTASCDQCIPY